MSDNPTLDGKVALVTGGAGGFGRAVTEILLEHGAQVALTDVDEERTRAAADELGAVPFVLDVTDWEANQKVVADIEQHFGGLDISFLNAGIGLNMGALAFDVERYRKIMAINLDGVAYGMQAAIPAMRRRGGGHIVATASMAGLVSMPGDPYYTMTKTGVVGLVRGAGPELIRENIKMNGICPGFADTPIIDSFRAKLEKDDFPVIAPRTVAQTVLKAATSDESGVCWLIQAGIEPAPFKFRGVPAARKPDGTPYGVPKDMDPDAANPTAQAGS